MIDTTTAYLAKLADVATLCIVLSVIFAALRATWRESPAFQAVARQFRREHVLPALGCFSVVFVAVGAALVLLPNR